MTTKKQGKPKARSWVRWAILAPEMMEPFTLRVTTYHQRVGAVANANPGQKAIKVRITEIPARKGRAAR